MYTYSTTNVLVLKKIVTFYKKNSVSVDYQWLSYVTMGVTMGVTTVTMLHFYTKTA